MRMGSGEIFTSSRVTMRALFKPRVCAATMFGFPGSPGACRQAMAPLTYLVSSMNSLHVFSTPPTSKLQLDCRWAGCLDGACSCAFHIKQVRQSRQPNKPYHTCSEASGEYTALCVAGAFTFEASCQYARVADSRIFHMNWSAGC